MSPNSWILSLLFLCSLGRVLGQSNVIREGESFSTSFTVPFASNEIQLTSSSEGFQATDIEILKDGAVIPIAVDVDGVVRGRLPADALERVELEIKAVVDDIDEILEYANLQVFSSNGEVSSLAENEPFRILSSSRSGVSLFAEGQEIEVVEAAGEFLSLVASEEVANAEIAVTRLSGEGEIARDLRFRFGSSEYEFRSGVARILQLSRDRPLEVEVLVDDHAEEDETFLIEATIDGIERTGRFTIPAGGNIVTTTRTEGEGTLAQALRNNRFSGEGETEVVFSDREGVPFHDLPQTIELTSSFTLRGDVKIIGPDKPGGVTITSEGRRRRGLFFFRTGGCVKNLRFEGVTLAIESSRGGGDVTVSDCEFVDCTEAVSLYQTGENEALVERCTFAGGDRGVTFETYLGNYRLQNCTFSDQPIAIEVFEDNPVTIEHCTVIGSSEALVGLRDRDIDVTMRNCLFESQLSAGAMVKDGGGNVFVGAWDGVIGEGSEFIADASSVSQYVAPLRDNGGSTRTIELLAGHPAIDFAVESIDGIELDQRGFERVVGYAPDAGAYEREVRGGDARITLETEAIYDEFSGLYYQWVLVANDSPWELQEAEVGISGLPNNLRLVNSDQEGRLISASAIAPGDVAAVMLQYAADRDDLRIAPALSVNLGQGAFSPMGDSSSDEPQLLEEDGRLVFSAATVPGVRYQVEWSQDLQNWQSVGHETYQQSRRMRWMLDDDGTHGYYRVVARE